MRTIIDLTDTQIGRLKAVAEREGISRAEAVRRAIDLAYADVAPNGSRAAWEAAFGSWKGRGIDALRYVDALRDEWEDRLAELHGSKYVAPLKRGGVTAYAKSKTAVRATRVGEKKRSGKPRRK